MMYKCKFFFSLINKSISNSFCWYSNILVISKAYIISKLSLNKTRPTSTPGTVTCQVAIFVSSKQIDLLKGNYCKMV